MSAVIKADEVIPVRRVQRQIGALTNNHEGELKPPLHRLPVHLVGEVSKANKCLQILLLLQEIKKKKDKKYVKTHKECSSFTPVRAKPDTFSSLSHQKTSISCFFSNLYFMGA